MYTVCENIVSQAAELSSLLRGTQYAKHLICGVSDVILGSHPLTDGFPACLAEENCVSTPIYMQVHFRKK